MKRSHIDPSKNTIGKPMT